MPTSPLAIDAAAALLGYLLGSIPFGVILTRIAGTQDLRAIGSGSIGATNVLRTGRKELAVATLLGDMLKGTAAVIIAGSFAGPTAAMIAGAAAFIGHLFPIWLKFKGGKGVATYIGVMLGLFWPAAFAFCIAWLATAFASKYSSLSALVASAVTPIFLWLLGQPALALFATVLALLLWVMHRENIKRLQAGTESKIGVPAAATSDPLGDTMAGHNGGPPLSDNARNKAKM